MQYTKDEDYIGKVAFEMMINDDGCRLLAIGYLGDSTGDL